MASTFRLSSAVLRQWRRFRHVPKTNPCISQGVHRRGYARMLPSPPQAEYTFGMSWQVITPLLLLGTGSVAMIVWYFSSNEFLDAGFPPRAAEAFRIASISADDWQLPHAIRYWRLGLEIAIAHGISPFDDRILNIKGRLMDTIKKDGDVAAEREVLEEIRQQAIQEIRSGNTNDRGKLVSLAVQASMSLGNSYQDGTDEDLKQRRKEFQTAIQLLHMENQIQRSLPNCPTEHWGWIPSKDERVVILKQIGQFAKEVNRPFLSLNYYLESLSVFPFNHPDSLDSMFQIGMLVQQCRQMNTLFSESQLLEQADIWFNRVIHIRESMPRNLPPSEKPVRDRRSSEGTYSLWGWDQLSDIAYVHAIWQSGINQRILGNHENAENQFDSAIKLSEELKLTSLHKEFRKARLEMQGKIEEARNPYFWDDTTGK